MNKNRVQSANAAQDASSADMAVNSLVGCVNMDSPEIAEAMRIVTENKEEAVRVVRAVNGMDEPSQGIGGASQAINPSQNTNSSASLNTRASLMDDTDIGEGISYKEYMKLMSEKDRKKMAQRNAKRNCAPLSMESMAFNTATDELIKNCKGTIYAYVRVSTDHQDYTRQLNHVKLFGLKDGDIYGEKKSGRNFDRPELQKLMEKLKPGDCLIIPTLDRFGRNMAEIKNHWYWVTRQRRCDIIVLDQPILNTNLNAEGIGSFIADIILAVFSLMAEIELDLIRRRMGDGLKQARLTGTKLGRKLKEVPALFWSLKEKFLGGLISQNKASKALNVDPKTFKAWMKRTGDALTAEEWDAIRPEIEEREKEERIQQAKMEYGESVADDAENGEDDIADSEAVEIDSELIETAGYGKVGAAESENTDLSEFGTCTVEKVGAIQNSVAEVEQESQKAGDSDYQDIPTIQTAESQDGQSEAWNKSDSRKQRATHQQPKTASEKKPLTPSQQGA